MSARYTPRIRLATVEDAVIIAHHRVEMFREIGQPLSTTLAGTLYDTSVAVIVDALLQQSYIGWLAIDELGEVIAGVGVHLKPQLPRLSPDGAKIVATPVPLVVNVYTKPAWRHQGIARALMQTLMQWAIAHGIDRVLLHASDAGRPLYASLGFVPTNEMRWTMGEAP